MIYEQLLHDFVDGSLDYQGEASLFNELQANESLRGELKMLMLMQKAVTHDVPAFSPAADSHDAIFRRLGFATGVEEASSQAAYGFRLGLLGKYMQGIIGGVVGAMVMAFLLTGIDHGGADRETRPGTANVSQSDISSKTPSSTHTSPKMSASSADGSEKNGSTSGAGGDIPPSGGEVRANASSSSLPRRAAVASVSTSSRANGVATNSGAREGGSSGNGADARDPLGARIENGGDPRTDITSISSADTTLAYAEPRPSLPAEPQSAAIGSHHADGPADFSSLHDLKVTEILPFSVEYRALTSRSFTARPEALENGSDALLRDKAIAAHYQIGDGRSVGIEIGQEEFYQRFEEQRPNGGDVILHEQNPVLFWGGASLRQTFFESSSVRPYVQVTAGGTRVGPIGRMMLGASFDLVPELQIIGGGEITTLAYSFDGRWYLSPKYALTYGFALRF